MIGFSTYGMRPEYIVPVARHAEALGFDGVWVGEHILEPLHSESVHPYGEGRARASIVTGSRTMYDLWVLVGGILGATSRLIVTTGIYLLPLRHPVLSARACISAQQLSGGRFRLGVGAGWWKEEFESLGLSFDERGRRTDEALLVLQGLLRGEALENPGPFYPFPKLRLIDAPVSLPILFGGTHGRALARAAELGDGWYGPTLPIDQAIALKLKIERLRAAAGRRGPYSFEARVGGEPTLENIRSWRDAGFDTIVVPWETIQGDHGFEIPLARIYERLEQIAQALALTR
jgi:alkanesulfonate monooxygenase SsuD/methylene tetrahydromethanopterin reductase-like flavin-dependent oxidoreductase (luciferase family)